MECAPRDDLVVGEPQRAHDPAVERPGRFVRVRLHRRIFAWFAGGIAATMLLTSFVFMVLGPEPEWRKQVNRGLSWVGTQFARQWDDPVARQNFAKETAETLEMSLELSDAAGAPLGEYGEPCDRHAYDIPIVRNGATLGLVRVYNPHGNPHT